VGGWACIFAYVFGVTLFCMYGFNEYND